MIPKRQYRVITQEELDHRKRRGLSLNPAAMLERGILLPIRGGEESEEEKKEREEKERKEKEEKDELEAKEKEEKEKKEKEEEEERKRKEKEDEEDVPVNKNELARLKRIAKEKDDADKKAKKEKDDAERKRKEEAGEFEELLNDERKKTAEETKRADDAEEKLKVFQFKAKVTQAAKDLNFEDPIDAFRFLDQEEHLESDERTLERALKKVLDKKTYLKGKRTATGGGGNGNKGGGNDHFTFDELRNMTEDEINENWEKPGFQEALTNAGRG